ncbi:MAG: tRNA (5-methylaminomethyl-2-thiouridine)(34)-methyltransferase MnmD [Bacteroidetes bacterium]|jgi:tRNA U34 5-methylaminomethyl-2-thiouridine-forming methyltransferase MnmC|nr:tRNA (5-methylaminomethyl-2-thiouridine)(34)-methyltransferase MnmD [Bacteroidota bacterium]
MEKQLKITRDGSATFYVPHLNEHYHSTHGAISESMHVFIQQGYYAFEGDPITILEMGLGTGLNALLTILEAEKNRKHVNYIALEKYPVESCLIEQLNYVQHIHQPNIAYLFNQIHSTPWEKAVAITKYFSLTKINADINDLKSDFRVHVIYFDAFAPEKQPELWTHEVFLRMYDFLMPNGLLTTYCAKGNVRRTMENVGFRVERLPGPPGKREMLRAVKPY